MKKIIIGFMLGGIVFTLGGVVSATVISSNQVTYQNKTVNNALDELYDEAVTGKELIAAAITNKGVSTNSNANYQTMATNIGSIDTDHSTINQKISNLESKHNTDISTINNTVNNLNQSLIWKHLGDVAGTSVGGNDSQLDLPQNYHELLILIRPVAVHGYDPRIVYSINATKEFIDTANSFQLPYYILTAGHAYSLDDKNQGSVGVRVSKTYVKVDWAHWYNIDTSQQYYMSVYYR